ncbi:phage protein NinX family protein [Providencia rettgeri]|uniref:phage protein NinX family protein n=1 Tax=Providencia rettgeri TaxID=587 RepID=UPI0011842A62|nr:phage protein NinX family protein [Providencia rettgeri]
MNKYTKLSDFEINKKVAARYYQNKDFIEAYKDVEKVFVDGDLFDPCNNPADAMPIIKDNFISITYDGIAWDVSCVKYPELSVWDGLENYNDNFYRKAMELFLLMKDAENENNNNS